MSEVDKLRSRLADAAAGKEADNLHPLSVRNNQTFKLTAGELLTACDTQPDHPNAVIFRKAVRNFPPTKDVVVERVDLEALLDDKEVEVKTTIEDHVDERGNKTGDKVRVERKVLGRSRTPRTATPPSAPPPTKGGKS